jgi:hypothetical protein
MTHNLRRIAEKRTKARLGFYLHATVFVFVNLMQPGINPFTMPWVFWSGLPFWGWSLGLAVHGLGVWLKTSDARGYRIEEEMDGLQRPQIFETPITSSVTVTEKPRESQH